MKFTLTIELGNDAMDSPKDVAKALRVLADDVGYNGYGMPGDGGSIRDINGNTVGKWEVQEMSKPLQEMMLNADCEPK